MTQRKRKQKEAAIEGTRHTATKPTRSREAKDGSGKSCTHRTRKTSGGEWDWLTLFFKIFRVFFGLFQRNNIRFFFRYRVEKKRGGDYLWRRGGNSAFVTGSSTFSGAMGGIIVPPNSEK